MEMRTEISRRDIVTVVGESVLVVERKIARLIEAKGRGIEGCGII
jgi:hypothetical protein